MDASPRTNRRAPVPVLAALGVVSPSPAMIRHIAHILSSVTFSAVALFDFSGCSSVTPVGHGAYTAVLVEHVQVLYQEPQRPYEVIALVSHGGGSRFATIQSVVGKCRELAAGYGADAVLITSTYDQTVGAAAQASGKALKWK